MQQQQLSQVVVSTSTSVKKTLVSGAGTSCGKITRVAQPGVPKASQAPNRLPLLLLIAHTLSRKARKLEIQGYQLPSRNWCRPHSGSRIMGLRIRRAARCTVLLAVIALASFSEALDPTCSALGTDLDECTTEADLSNDQAIIEEFLTDSEPERNTIDEQNESPSSKCLTCHMRCAGCSHPLQPFNGLRHKFSVVSEGAVSAVKTVYKVAAPMLDTAKNMAKPVIATAKE
eukprot:16799-Heterococcus_DN1.PRE.1